MGMTPMDLGCQEGIAPTRPSVVHAGDLAPDAQHEANSPGLYGRLQWPETYGVERACFRESKKHLSDDCGMHLATL